MPAGKAQSLQSRSRGPPAELAAGLVCEKPHAHEREVVSTAADPVGKKLRTHARGLRLARRLEKSDVTLTVVDRQRQRVRAVGTLSAADVVRTAFDGAKRSVFRRKMTPYHGRGPHPRRPITPSMTLAAMTLTDPLTDP